MFRSASPRQSGRRLLHRALSAGAFLAVGAGFALAGAAPANADWYDAKALDTSCVQSVNGLGKADRCRYEISSVGHTNGRQQRVSGFFWNCGSAENEKKLTWSQSVTETDSIEVGASVEVGISKIVGASFQTTYGHSWAYEKSTGGEDTVKVPSHRVGWLERAAPLRVTKGRMVINYGKRRYGHYEWYTYPTITAPDTSVTARNTVAFDRPMTKAELKSICRIG